MPYASESSLATIATDAVLHYKVAAIYVDPDSIAVERHDAVTGSEQFGRLEAHRCKSPCRGSGDYEPPFPLAARITLANVPRANRHCAREAYGESKHRDNYGLNEVARDSSRL